MFLLNSLHFGSLRRRFSTMFVRSVFALFSLACLSAAILFTGCSTEDDSGHLNGTWRLFSEPAYVIDTSAMTIQHFGWSGDGYTGNIVNSPDFTAKNGILIIRFTEYLEAEFDENWDVVGINRNPPNTVGWYGALYWRNLTSSSVLMADFWGLVDGDFVHVMFPTLEEATMHFTNARSNEINWGGIAAHTR